MSKIIKDAIILTVITLIAGFGLGYVHDITAAPIAKAQEDKKQRAYKAVMPDASTFDNVDVDEAMMAGFEAAGYNKQIVTGVVEGKDDSGASIGYVITVISNQGFGGAIEMSVGISTANMGEVTGVDFLSMSESPGLGDNAKKPEFKERYVGKAVEKYVVVKEAPKSDDQILTITGATITSRAVTQGVDAALLYFQEAFAKGGAN